MASRPHKLAADSLEELAGAVGLLTGRQATTEERQCFSRYLDLLLIWNRAQRLTGLRSPASIVRNLFQDSLLFLARLPPGPLAMVDIGAGAGIPGIPLRIVRPDISLTLIESRRKRVSFLLSLKRELGLSDVEIREGRAEALIGGSPELLEEFDVAVSRAVGPLPDLLPTAMSYVKAGGLLMVSGPPPEKARPAVLKDLRIEWEVINFPSLGVRRTFLLVTKRAVP